MKRPRSSSASCANSSKKRKVVCNPKPATNIRESEEIDEKKRKPTMLNFFDIS